MYLVASICPSVCLHSHSSALLSAARSNKSHYQSKIFVYADTCMDPVNRLLIYSSLYSITLLKTVPLHSQTELVDWPEEAMSHQNQMTINTSSGIA